MSADITMEALAAEFEKLTKINQNIDGAMSMDDIRNGLNMGGDKARRLVGDGVRAKILEVRKVTVESITGVPMRVPRYFLVKKPETKTPIRNGRKPA